MCKHPDGERRPSGRCKPCGTERDKARANRPERREQHYQTQRRQNLRIRIAVLTHYGNGELRCMCCKEEKHIVFLQLDHINDDGYLERKSLKAQGSLGAGADFYRRLRDAGYPMGYQTLCCDCNHAKSYWPGGCPHQSGISVEEALTTNTNRPATVHSSQFPSGDLSISS